MNKKQLRIGLQNMKEQVTSGKGARRQAYRQKFTSTNVGARLTPNIASTFTGSIVRHF